MGIVYLLKSNNGDCNLYKSGITKYKAEKRIKSLQTGNGNDITVVETFESKYYNKIETALHRRHVSKKVRGEWFELTKDDVKNFLSECQQMHDNFELLTNSGNPFI